MSTATATVVHHLYANGPGHDLIPYCGVIPGPDKLTGEWNTGHDRDELLQCVGFGLLSCPACLASKALGGLTPLILNNGSDFV